MPQSRIQWIDAARGLAVTLVVLFHFLIWNHPQVTGGASPLEPIWEDVRFITGRLRMPILMAISGYLAASSIAAGWGRTRVRVAANYWVYAVWLTAYYAFFAALERMVPGVTFPNSVSTLEGWASNLVLPDTVLWFILALAVFPVVILLVRRSGVPWWMILLIATAIWAWGTYTDIPDSIGKLARTFVFFVIGCAMYGKLDRLPRLGIIGAVAITGGFVLAAATFPRAFYYDTGILLAAITALVWVATAMPVFVKWKPAGRLGSFVGSRTVEIYVLHSPLLILMSLITRDRPAWLTALVANPIGDALFVVGSVTLVVVVALVVGAAGRLIPRNPLFSFPWKDRLTPKEPMDDAERFGVRVGGR